MDYAQARYYSSALGRFTSTDEFKGGPDELWVLGSGDSEKQALVYADIFNPQSLNKYQYAYNNPLRYVDPNGQSPQDGLEVQLRADERALAQGKITRQEFIDRQTARGIGGVAGAAIVAAAILGPRAAIAILMAAARNPDKVQQIATAAQEAAGGPPGLTVSAGSRLTQAEISTGGRLAEQGGLRLVQSEHIGAEFVDAAGKTYDAMGGGQAYKYFGSGKQFFDSIAHHVNKSVDYVAIDLKGASKGQVKAIENFVRGLKEEQRNKIIYVR